MPNPTQGGGAGGRETALAEVRDLLRYAKEATNKISNARRKHGPLATQAQSASHALAKADAILSALQAAPSEEPDAAAIDVPDLQTRVESAISSACSAYNQGHYGPVKTRPERRADAIRRGVDAVLAAIGQKRTDR